MSGTTNDDDLLRDRIAELETKAQDDNELIDGLRAATAVDLDLIKLLEAEGVADRANIANLEIALISARRIGAAIGILMANHRITENAAFGLLSEASQHRNKKVRDVADEVLLTGVLSGQK